MNENNKTAIPKKNILKPNLVKRTEPFSVFGKCLGKTKKSVISSITLALFHSIELREENTTIIGTKKEIKL